MREKRNVVPANAYHLCSHITTERVFKPVFIHHFSSLSSSLQIVCVCLAFTEFYLQCFYYVQKKKKMVKNAFKRLIDYLFRTIHSVCIILMCSDCTVR